MNGIYRLPLAIAVPVVALVWVMGIAGLNGSGWSELIVLGIVLSAAYYGLTYAFGLLPEHRQAVSAWAWAHLSRVGLR